MAAILIQHALQASSQLAEDRYVNTFHLTTTGDPAPADFAGWVLALQEFYGDANGIRSLGQYLSDAAASIGRTIKVYDLADAKPRAPIFEFTDPLTSFSSNPETNYPSEVAVCLSYQASKVSGVPMARRRGRIYIGPLCVKAGTNDTVGFQDRPSIGFQQAILDAAEDLAVAFAANNALWSVYSRADDPGDTGDTAAFHPIIQFSVDNAFDTQRRRGCAPTLRTIRQLAV